MRIRQLLVPISLLLSLSACGPLPSLNPLFNEKDVVFDDAVVGTWITSAATKGTPNEGLTYTFEKWGSNAYEVTFPGDDGSKLKSVVHLLRLGKFLFLDANAAELDSAEQEQNNAPQPFPQIRVHLFGRIWVEKDFLRIALLDKEWVQKMAEEKKLTVGYASSDDGTVLTASTEELQKLALQYAEDTKAFSQEVDLCRPGQLSASDCSVALFKQKLATNDPIAWDSLGQEYSKVGRDDEALAAFSKAAQLDPSGGDDAHNYHHNIGRALLKKSQYEQARTEFLEAHRLRPTDSTPDGQIGFSYFLERKFQDAVLAFETEPWDVSCATQGCQARGRIERYPNNLTIFATLALRHVGRQEESKKELGRYTRQEEAFAKSREHPEWEALLLSYEGGLTTESELIRKAETPEQRSEAYFYVGYEYFLRGDKFKAREYFEKTVDTKLADCDEYIAARARLTQLSPK